METDYFSPLSPRMHPIIEEVEVENELITTPSSDAANIENNITDELPTYHSDEILHSIRLFIDNFKSPPSKFGNSPIVSLLLYIKQLNESVRDLLKYKDILQLLNTNKNCHPILSSLKKFNQDIISHINNHTGSHNQTLSNTLDAITYKNCILSPQHSSKNSGSDQQQQQQQQPQPHVPDEDTKEDESNHTNDASEGKENIDLKRIAKLKQREAQKKVLKEMKRRNIDENFNFFESYYVLKQETNYRLHSQQHYSGKLGLKNISRLQLLRLALNIITRKAEINVDQHELLDILRGIFHSKLNGKRFQSISFVRFQKILNLSNELSFKIYNNIKKYFERNNSRSSANKKDIEHYYQGRLYIDRKFIIMNDILYANYEYEQMFKISDEKASEDEIYDAQNYGDIYRVNGTNPSLLFKKIELECFDDLQSVLNEQYGLKIFDENCQLYFGTEVDYNDDGEQIEYISSRLIMSEYKGKTLAEKIYDYAEENDYLTQFDIGMILYKILLAVQQTHRKNVIHCDLKPDNMIINMLKDTQVQDNDEKHKKIMINLIDFGYCEIVRGKDFIIQKHLIKGTRGYIAPEIFTDYKYSKKSDIFSIGCIGFEMVTGGTLPSDYDINGDYVDKDTSDEEDESDDGDEPKVLDVDIEGILKKENKKRQLDNRISPKLIKFISKLLSYEYDERYDTSNAVLVARKNWSKMKQVKHQTAFF